MSFDLRDLLTINSGHDHPNHLPEVEQNATETLLLFMRTFRDIHTELEARLSHYGITQGRFMLLKIMYRSPETHLTPSELAEQAGVTRGTVTGLIDGLERDGLIERKRQLGTDRRMVTIQLTPTAWRLMEQLLPYYVKGMNLLLSDFTEEDRAVLVSLIDKLKRGLQKVKNQLDDSV